MESKPTLQTHFGDYDASLVDGKWQYEPIVKGMGAVKISTNPKYKDPVQFKIMEQYEGHSKERYKKQLGIMALEIVGYLKGI